MRLESLKCAARTKRHQAAHGPGSVSQQEPSLAPWAGEQRARRMRRFVTRGVRLWAVRRGRTLLRSWCAGDRLPQRALKTVTRRIANPRKNGPAPWKPIVGLSGPARLPIAFDS